MSHGLPLAGLSITLLFSMACAENQPLGRVPAHDAGRLPYFDAGARFDAGRPTGSDGGSLDAGISPDAGMPDAGMPDAGMRDAGRACIPQAETCDGIDQDCDGVIDNGCPSGTTRLGATEVDTPTVGEVPPDGSPFRLRCPSGQVITGVFGADDDISVRRIGIHCGRPTVVADRTRNPYRYSIVMTPGGSAGPTTGSASHSATADSFDWRSERGVYRLRGYLTDRGEWLQFLSVYAQSPVVEGGIGSYVVRRRTSVTQSRGFGGLAGAVFDRDVECPVDHFAVELRGYAALTGRIENLVLGCRSIVVDLE